MRFASPLSSARLASTRSDSACSHGQMCATHSLHAQSPNELSVLVSLCLKGSLELEEDNVAADARKDRSVLFAWRGSVRAQQRRRNLNVNAHRRQERE